MFAAWDPPLASAERHAEGARGAVAGGRLSTGDAGAGADALEAWLGRMRPRLIGLGTRLLGSPHDAEEIAQEALTLAWQRVRRLRNPGGRDAWLYRTTVNLCLNRRRRKRRDARASVDVAALCANNASDGHAARELTDRVRQAMADLPDRQYAALVLREMEGLSYKEMAAVLKARPAAVRVLVHRARETLRRTLLKRWPEAFGPDR